MRMKIGQVPPGTPAAAARKGFKPFGGAGVFRKIGGEVSSSVKRVQTQTEDAATKATRARLQAVEQGVTNALQPGASDAPPGSPEDQAHREAVQDDAMDELEGISDYISGLADAGHPSAGVLVGALEDVLQIVKSTTMTFRAPPQPQAQQAPQYATVEQQETIVTPADEGPIDVPPRTSGVPRAAGVRAAGLPPGFVKVANINPADLANDPDAQDAQEYPPGYGLAPAPRRGWIRFPGLRAGAPAPGGPGINPGHPVHNARVRHRRRVARRGRR